jgi:hypothetical protein
VEGPSTSPSFGENLVSGNDVVWIALVFSQALTERCAIGVTQRNRRRICSETCPNYLDKGQPLFCGKLENISDVSITHGV